MGISALFTPGRFGNVAIKNRVVMAPLTRMRADIHGVPHPLAATYYEQRASAGLIVSEGTQISPQGRGYPGTPGIHSPQQVAAWREIVDAVHRRDGAIVCQLWHVGRISHSSLLPPGCLPVGPSAVRPNGHAWTYDGEVAYELPQALSIAGIAAVVEEYSRAARNAKEAGFDGVEIHGANGYLIDQFIQDGTNQRDDDYGGDRQRRLRFLSEVVEATTAVWGPGRVGVRLSPHGTFNDISDSDSERTFRAAIASLNGRGLAYLHLVEPRVSGADSVARPAHETTGDMALGCDAPLVRAGGFNRDTAMQAVDGGAAYAVAFGRWFIANPDLPRRLELQREMNPYIRATFYGGDAVGYTDYPFLVS